MQDVDQLPETRCESTVPRACSVDMAALVQIRMRSISSTVTVSARPVVDGLIAGGARSMTFGRLDGSRAGQPQRRRHGPISNSHTISEMSFVVNSRSRHLQKR